MLKTRMIGIACVWQTPPIRAPACGAVGYGHKPLLGLVAVFPLENKLAASNLGRVGVRSAQRHCQPWGWAIAPQGTSPWPAHVKVYRALDLIKPGRHVNQGHHVAGVDGNLGRQDEQLTGG
jgi:hypothetical protein